MRGIVRTTIAAALLLAATVAPGARGASMTKWGPVVNPPEFPEGLEWLNVEKPLKLADLRGKVVLLDFWTYCCINCIHIMPDLKRLEAKYGSSLVVIGVHSAKFTTEQGTDNIRQAILRYGLEHPVVNDKDFKVWNAYAVRAWPTLVLIDPRGKIVRQASGEGAFDKFDAPIGELVETARAAGTLDAKPLALELERDRAPRSVLSFPGKVLADAASNRLFVSDSNHNRVVVANLSDGAVVDVIGSGAEGLDDGAFGAATFRKPQGLALDGGALYVADTENHAIRRVDLAKKTVETIGGTGAQAQAFNVAGVGRGVALNSPWDLVARDGALYVAMAGFHQIWKMDLASGRLEPYAGTGEENRGDGTRAVSAFAQPSGLALDGPTLYVADSEVSSIRAVDTGESASVKTVVGEALFEFGDVDGAGERVRLQHPLGVAAAGGALYVADTYNNKIKRIDPAARESKTFAGSGAGGYADGAAGSAKFDEPGGVSVANGVLYVADTNNGAIRTVDLATGRVGTVAFKGLERLAPPAAADAPFSGEVVDVPAAKVAPGEAGVVLDVAIPRGYKVNAEAPFFVGLRADAPAVAAVPAASAGVVRPNPSFPVRLPFSASAGAATLTLDAVVYYCEAGKESLCYVKQLRFRVPVTVVAGGARDVRVAYTIKP